MWLQWCRNFFLQQHVETLKSSEYAMYFYWMLDWPRSAWFSQQSHTVRNLPLKAKNKKTCLILSSLPCKANFSPQFPRTREEMALQQTALPGSLLSSFLAASCQADISKLQMIKFHQEKLLEGKIGHSEKNQFPKVNCQQVEFTGLKSLQCEHHYCQPLFSPMFTQTTHKFFACSPHVGFGDLWA